MNNNLNIINHLNFRPLAYPISTCTLKVGRDTMISERQQEANRRNAAKSHGPITPEGRAAVRHNALKHGLKAAEIILPSVEEKIDFEQFRFAFEEEYKPEGPIEEVLVEDMVISRWRLNRIRKMEPGFFSLRLEEPEGTQERLLLQPRRPSPPRLRRSRRRAGYRHPRRGSR